jgi:hypothetical protein
MAIPKVRAHRGRPVVKDKSCKTIGYRVTSAYLGWITRVTTVNGSTVSGLIDLAVAKYAWEISVSDPPPNRTA